MKRRSSQGSTAQEGGAEGWRGEGGWGKRKAEGEEACDTNQIKRRRGKERRVGGGGGNERIWCSVALAGIAHDSRLEQSEYIATAT